jgi:hypothetical protein
MMEEKRKHPRVVYTANVDILPTANRRILYKGLIKNISLGGIAVETERDLLVGSEHKVSFFLPDKKNIKAVGNIVWEYKDKHSNYYGVQFKSLGFFHKLKLKWFISKKLKSEKQN